MGGSRGPVVSAIIGVLTLGLAGPTLGAYAIYIGYVRSGTGVAADAEAWVDPGAIVDFSIVVEGDPTVLPSGFNQADVIIGSHELPAFTFLYSADWNTAMTTVYPITGPIGFYGSYDLYVGGNSPGSVVSSLALGTVTVDTTGLANGDYYVTISKSVDGISVLGFNATMDSLEGQGIIHIPIPEPATLALLALGGLALLGRRR